MKYIQVIWKELQSIIDLNTIYYKQINTDFLSKVIQLCNSLG